MTIRRPPPSGAIRSMQEDVEEAVRRAGRGRAVFALADIQRELDPDLGFAVPSDITLRRHLRRLEPEVLTRLAPCVTWLVQVDASLYADRRSASPRFTLSSVRPTAMPVETAVLDDLGRALLALHIATRVAQTSIVPTRLVTAVLHAEATLTLTSTQQTATLLERMATDYPTIVARAPSRGRSARWRVVAPLREDWDALAERIRERQARPLDRRARAAREGAASNAQLVARLVDLAGRRIEGKRWPNGRPVTGREIARQIAEARVLDGHEAPIVAVADVLLRRTGDLAGALQAATRERFDAGHVARAPEVRRVVHSQLPEPWFAPRSMPVATSEAWLLWRRLRFATSRHAMRALSNERQQAAAFASQSDPVLRAIGCTRLLIARQRLTGALELITAMGAHASAVSGTLELARVSVRDQMERASDTWGPVAAVEQRAWEALLEVGFFLPEVLAASRPTMTQEAFAALMPPAMRAGQSSGLLTANATTVRRVAMSTGGRQTRVGTGRAPMYRLDRADAMLYLAENAVLPGRRAFIDGSRLVGPWLAFTPLVELVTRHAEPAVRGAALGALALLGDDAAVARELAWREANPARLVRSDEIDAREIAYWSAP